MQKNQQERVRSKVGINMYYWDCAISCALKATKPGLSWGGYPENKMIFVKKWLSKLACLLREAQKYIR